MRETFPIHIDGRRYELRYSISSLEKLESELGQRSADITQRLSRCWNAGIQAARKHNVFDESPEDVRRKAMEEAQAKAGDMDFSTREIVRLFWAALLPDNPGMSVAEATELIEKIDAPTEAEQISVALYGVAAAFFLRSASKSDAEAIRKTFRLLLGNRFRSSIGPDAEGSHSELESRSASSGSTAR